MFDPDFDYDDVNEDDTKPALVWIVSVVIAAAVAIFTVGVIVGSVFG